MGFWAGCGVAAHCGSRGRQRDLKLGAGARLQSFLAHLKCLLPLDLVERPLGVPKPSPPEVSEALAGEQVAERRIGSVWVDRAFLPPTL